MASQHTKPHAHAEFRHRSQLPMPAVEEVEQRLADLLSPSLLAPRQLERRDLQQPQRFIRMRLRLLTLPMMVAIVVSLVWRRMPAVTEVQRSPARERLLWVAPVQVSPQALTKQLNGLPAAVMGQLFAEVCARVQAQEPPALPYPLDAASIEKITEAFLSSVRAFTVVTSGCLNQRVMRLRLVV